MKVLFDWFNCVWVFIHYVWFLGGFMQILIVDKSKLNTEIAREALIEAKLTDTIETCLSGEEALEFMSFNKVDLVLIDIIMPGLTGVDFLKILDEKGWLKHSKVIMLTTIDDLQILKECFELGAVDYIHKPFNKIEFSVRVKSVLTGIERHNRLIKDKEQMDLKYNHLSHENNQLKRINEILRGKKLSEI